jgi:hypothetical protein
MTGVAIGSTNLGTAYMAQIATPPSGVNAASAFIDRRATPDPEEAMRATAARTFGTVNLFQLPSTMSSYFPAGWSSGGGYLITLTGYSDQASAAAGATTNSPTAAASAGSISYWNGSGFTSVNVTSLSPGVTIGSTARTAVWPAVTSGPPSARRWVCASVAPSLTYDGPSTSSVGSPRTSAKASIGSPIHGTVTYRVDIYTTDPGNCTTPSGTLLSTPVDLTVSIDLGTAKAAVTYRPAPRGV